MKKLLYLLIANAALVFNPLYVIGQDAAPTGAQTATYIEEKLEATQKLIFIGKDMFDLTKKNSSTMWIRANFSDCGGNNANGSVGKNCKLILTYLRYSNLELYEHNNEYGWTFGNGSCEDFIFKVTQEFLLKDVVDVVQSTKDEINSPIKILDVKLTTAVGINDFEQYYYSDNRPDGRCSRWEKCNLPQCSRRSVDTMFLPYLSTDPANFERLKKAILHLASLSKTVAGKDMFDN